MSWKPDSIADDTCEVLCLPVVCVCVSFFSLSAFVLFCLGSEGEDFL